MTDARKILGEFVSYEEKEFYGVNKYVVTYKQPNSADPSKEWKHQAVEADLTDKAIEQLVSLSAGERMCVHQDKDDKGYPVIVDISDAKDAPAKAAGGKTWTKGGGFAPRDDTGVTVGAAWTNAIEILKISGTLNGSQTATIIEEVDKLVDAIIKLKQIQEGKVRASKAAKQAAGEKATEAAKPKSRAELLKEKKAAEAAPKSKAVAAPPEEEPEIATDELDDVNFDE